MAARVPAPLRPRAAPHSTPSGPTSSASPPSARAAAVPGLPGSPLARCSPRRPGPSCARLGRDLPGPFGLAAGFDKNARRRCAGLTMLGFAFVEVGTDHRAGPARQRAAAAVARARPAGACATGWASTTRGRPRSPRRLRRLRATPAGRRLVVGVEHRQDQGDPAPRTRRPTTRRAPACSRRTPTTSWSTCRPRTRPGCATCSRSRRCARSSSPCATPPTTPPVASGAPATVPSRCSSRSRPDLSDDDVDAVADLALELGLAGVVAVNTTIGHDRGPGGLSGPPAAAARARGRRAGCGPGSGPTRWSSASAASPRRTTPRAYLAAGATLVQGYTGFVYRGPLWAARINARCARALEPAGPVAGRVGPASSDARVAA